LTPESRLHTLIDDSREFALYFLEGQRLIEDMALLHPIRRTGFAYFRDVVLSVQPMVALLKHGEQFGFYIDSEEPYFRLKIETAHHGSTRCMLLPEEFQEFPEAMHGLVRMHKLCPSSPPYESVLKVEGLPLREIVNRVLDDSYQVNCAMMLSQVSDQSVLLHQLPPLPGKDEYEYSPEAVRARREGIRSAVRDIFARALHEPSEIASAFAAIGFRLLAHRPMRFRCSCSRGRMVENLRPVYQQEGDSLFEPGAGDLEVVCEYCKSRYRIDRRELTTGVDRAH
jgi:molecular chaperone Hsp33